ncbi:SDR family NAD(P)-dependent oxidoreductase [Pseudonocardia sp. NPDC049154]|uniref:SDR family NAD(P)-dependent oxidoreductase n=1 Tax=Pseudonocardia sp. NPDC049154 TaxID=3155501 RepID=UPI0033EE8D3B
MLGMKHEGRAMQAAGGGAIVNLASLNSAIPMRGGSAHCAAKAGVAMLSACGALDVLPGQVGDAAGGWMAADSGVSAVVIVEVQPAG